MTELATVFEDADLIDLEPVIGHRAASTPETRERYAFLKTKRQGSAWEEDNRLYVTSATNGCSDGPARASALRTLIFDRDLLGSTFGEWPGAEGKRPMPHKAARHSLIRTPSQGRKSTGPNQPKPGE
jgi:hypothetical protein